MSKSWGDKFSLQVHKFNGMDVGMAVNKFNGII